MNKSAIEKFAIWARKKLIREITYKAGLLGVTEKGIAEPLPQSAKDMQLFDVGTKNYTEVTGAAIGQRAALVAEIKSRERSTDFKTAFGAVVEEVAYTWFNRLIAIRFMEVNGYLPSRIRVLSSENPAKNEPDFVTTPFETDLPFTAEEQDKILRCKDENRLDELFQMLFIKQCNQLHEILPELFETTSDYTELLLTISFTDKDGVVYHLTHDIEEKDFDVEKEGQVEIIGWLYQYYNSELKDETFAQLKKNVKITRERIPAATQLFTPDWIVRYMVENSLGRLWVEGHPNDSLKADWKYYLEEAEQEESVKAELEKIRREYAALKPEDIKFIDPCMGSGHILVYAFDVLMQIYESQGYTQRDAARSIITNNLYGLDIDRRAYQLAYFAVMMKARQYNRRILTENIQLNLFVVDDSTALTTAAIDYIAGGDKKLRSDLQSIKDDLTDAREYGSLVNVSPVDFDAIDRRIEEIEQADLSMDRDEVLREFPQLLRQASAMAQKYHVVVTNPPYMGNNGFNHKLGDFIKAFYNDVKGDLFAAMMTKASNMTNANGIYSMITQQSWMFLSSYEALRKRISHESILTLAHLGSHAFDEIGGEMVSTTTFAIRKSDMPRYRGKYRRLVDYPGEQGKAEAFFITNTFFEARQVSFEAIPGKPIAYWTSEKVANAFTVGSSITKYVDTFQGIITGDNEKFLRQWFEVSINRIPLHAKCMDEFDLSDKYWIPYNKGGEFRKWYGGQDYVVFWKFGPNDKTRGKKGFSQYYLREYVAWSYTISNSIATRYYPQGFLWDVRGSGIMDKSNMLYYLEGLISSKIGITLFQVNNSTLSCQVENIVQLPIIADEGKKDTVEQVVKENNELSKSEWDSFETSWDFACHPLVPTAAGKKEQINSQFVASRMEKFGRIAWHFEKWQLECEDRFSQLKANEEELNRIFIDIYGLQDELTPEVEDKDVTVRKADLKRDIRSLISYAVGCMFGRYSPYKEGLIFAGGEWDYNKFENFAWQEEGKPDMVEFHKAGTQFFPDQDNIIPICDDGYFQDDIVGRFIEWVDVVYGHDTMEENLKFIADALGNKGSSSVEVIRNYFLNDFYADHCKIYQKRPIYWLFDSGKQNGFKALVYMHRWNADTTGNLRVEYLHKMQRVYEREIERMQEIIDTGTDNREIAAATKRKDKLQKQLKETKDYDAKVGHLALARIDIDLDDGVNVNYEKVQTGTDGQKLEILAKRK